MEVIGMIILFAIALLLIVAGVWGKAGGMVRSQVNKMQANEAVIRRMFKPESFSADVVRCAWPPSANALPPTALAVDRGRHILMVCETVGKAWKAFKFTPEKISAVELLEDARTVGQVSRGAQIGGALLGGMIGGGAGAVIGGLSSGQSSISTVSRVGLLLMLEGANGPITIDFCLWDSTTTKGWMDLPPDGQRRMTAEGREWMHMLEALMRSSGSDNLVKS